MRHIALVDTTRPPPGKRRPAPPVPAARVATYRPQSTLRRLVTTLHHLVALGIGAIVAPADPDARGRSTAPPGRDPRARRARRVLAALLRPFVRVDLRDEPFRVHFRRRLELLGPTYIKLGQILSLREDILPTSITDELKLLLNGLPAVPFSVFLRQVENDLGRAAGEMFIDIDPEPIGSASIAQIHRATTVDGDDVVIKVVKPGIRQTLERDARILGLLGTILNSLLPRYQPKRIIAEFCDYTLREVDLTREADNAETFAANFADVPDVVFPRVFRAWSGRSVLTMEYLDGLRPDSLEAQALPREQRERLIDLGALAIIRMLYRDGVFHADLHPANLLILPNTRVGFIDLGMVGRMDGELRRTMMYYYYCLVTGDAESAARYLGAVAIPGPHADPVGFRREVTEISSRWRLAATFEGFSLARLILESLTRSAKYGMYFPVELVLMVKALVTFEGVGHVLLPGFDVAAVSKKHIRRIFINQFNPLRFMAEEVRQAPDLLDAAVKLPLLVTEGLRVLDRAMQQRSENPFAGIRGTLIAGFCLVAGAILMSFAAPWPLYTALFATAFLLAVRRGGDA